jgi:hypothetical protein
MVAFTTLFSLASLLPILLASGSPVKRSSSCSLNGVTIPNLPPPLVEPTLPISWVGVAIGTQNYTCGSTGTYTNVGAVAELFDISCLYGTPYFDSIGELAIMAWQAAPPTITVQEIIASFHALPVQAVIGQHYYVPNPITGSGINPKWDFTSSGSTAGNANAYVVAAKVNAANAPTGPQDITYVQLNSIAGLLAQQVYRVDTHLGQPPASCTPGSSDTIAVKYSAKYYGFGGSIKV